MKTKLIKADFTSIDEGRFFALYIGSPNTSRKVGIIGHVWHSDVWPTYGIRLLLWKWQLIIAWESINPVRKIIKIVRGIRRKK